MDIEKEVNPPDPQIAGSEIAVLSITNNGKEIASKIRTFLPDAAAFSSPMSVREFVSINWNRYRGVIFIMATGIVVRAISQFIKDKDTDPAVLVIDEKGRFVISLLSGHIGGANALAKRVAGYLGAEAVITTASDISGLPAIDLWAKENDLSAEDRHVMRKVQAKLINNGSLKVYTGQDVSIKLPEGFLLVSDPGSADVLITNRICHDLTGTDTLILRPRNLIVGIGCKKGSKAEEIEDMVRGTLEKYNLSFKSIRGIATIEQKKDETGLLEFAGTNGIQIRFFSADELNTIEGIAVSEDVFNATGANAVAEPSAMLGADAGTLLIPKHKRGNVTVAAAELGSGAEEYTELITPEMEHTQQITRKGKITVVGTGPGNILHITPAAQKAIRESDVVIGYRTYMELVRGLIKDKEVILFGMTQEIDRCRKAIELASSGRSVALISGGDPGIYAMAGLVFEMLRAQNTATGTHDPQIQVEIIPGIPALNAVASRLGAPLMHDFCSISLSDLLTPWEIIEKRLEAAASSDFVMVLYNPKSRGRTEQIKRARDIILLYRPPSTPVGIVKAAMRENEKIILTDLGEMASYEHEIDMQTTVIIGNSNTFIWKEWMVTPRGYKV
ncbi:MAG: precorrin-3B C(17)-methyltransferase [Nitrospirae bacterium]|nr:precorrin-3B C(17)-methyltransferase [Nitrospirota bacterium]